MANTYQNNLPDLDRCQRLKVVEPVLSMNTIDAEARWCDIRKDIDVEAILNRLYEELKDLNLSSLKMQEKEITTWKRLCEDMRAEVVAELNNEKITVTKGAINLASIVVNGNRGRNYDLDQYYSSELRNPSSSIFKMRSLDIAVEDFLPYETQHRHTDVEDRRNNKTFEKTDFGHHSELGLSYASRKVPQNSPAGHPKRRKLTHNKEMEGVLLQPADHHIPATERTQYKYAGRLESQTPSRDETFSSKSCFYSERQIVKQQSPPRGSSGLSTGTENMVSPQKEMKVAVPRLELEDDVGVWRRLTGKDLLDEGLNIHPNLVVEKLEEPQQTIQVALSIPAFGDVLKESIDVCEKSLAAMIAKPQNIINSGELLWKEPGLRILDIVETDAENLLDEIVSSHRNKGGLASDLSHVSQIEQSISSKVGPGACTDTYDNDVSPKPERSSTILPEGHSIDKREGQEHGSSPHIQPKPSLIQTEATPCTSQSTNGDLLDRVANTITQRSTPEDCDHVLEHVRQRDMKASSKMASCHGQVWSAAGSLDSFLDLRGKRFRKDQEKWAKGATELLHDPIEASQASIKQGRGDDSHVHNSEETKSNRSSLPSSLKGNQNVQPLNRDRTIILNNSLLQSKPSLIRFLDQHGTDHLTVIYRDFDAANVRSPDILLDATTCIVLRNLQSLTQRPLPGPGKRNEQPMTYQQIRVLAQEYEKVLVVLQYVIPENCQLTQHQSETMAKFAGFCWAIQQEKGEPASLVRSIWVSSDTTESLSDSLNLQIWALIRKYSYPLHQLGEKLGCGLESSVVLIHDETLWELFLRRAGMNPFSAQLVLAMLQKVNKDIHDLWGLSRFVLMTFEERLATFGATLGHDVIRQISNVLDRPI